MFFRKQNPSPPMPPWAKEKDREKLQTYQQSKDQSHNLKKTIILFIFLFSWLLILSFWVPQKTTQNNDGNNGNDNAVLSAPKCNANFSVYVYDLPAEFNTRLADDCKHLNVYTDMCPHVTNRGLGQPINASRLHLEAQDPTRPSWFATHQFIAEMIFHARVENHPCRTFDPSSATLFYAPFYGGLHASSKFREPNLTARDDLAVRFADFISRQPWFDRHNGRDHFIALGRTAWDFMRATNPSDFGANALLNSPAVMNMSVMTVERNPWHGKNQHGIPYPSYFHPSTDQELATWQKLIKRSSRPNLFSFIGGPRKGLEKAAIRDELIKQCGGSERCELLRCGGADHACHDPVRVMAVMMRSEFCLQAPGDSFTRRSTFDAMLAGCVPVFFSAHTAYTQYAWFVPAEPSEWSVFLDGGGASVEDALAAISGERVKRMRERVIEFIPNMIYAHPNATNKSFDDAVDVALGSLAKHVGLDDM